MLQIERKAKHALQNELDALMEQMQAHKGSQRRQTQFSPGGAASSPEVLKAMQDR